VEKRRGDDDIAVSAFNLGDSLGIREDAKRVQEIVRRVVRRDFCSGDVDEFPAAFFVHIQGILSAIGDC
jgi:hypothetical protein